MMTLSGFTLYRYSVPLVTPLALKGETLDRREGWLVRLESDTGTVGWGEVSPLPGFSRETLEGVQQQLVSLQGAFVGRPVETGWSEPDGRFAREVDALALVPSVRFGLELAAWNLLAAAQGIPLPALITPQPCATVSVNALLTGAEEDVLDTARRLSADGYRAVKLKVGRGSVEEEAALVRALGHLLGSEVRLRLDANRAWSLEQALAFAHRLGDTPVEYIEEPLAHPERLSLFAARSGVPVALDETLVGLSPEALPRHAYARAVILKPTVMGGLIPTLRMARRAEALGMTPVISAAFETGVGMLGLVALAAAVGTQDVPVGL
ncbi:MAG: o-succinylbenzoate synthase, partial [Rhodothermales bacterium]